MVEVAVTFGVILLWNVLSLIGMF